LLGVQANNGRRTTDPETSHYRPLGFFFAGFAALFFADFFDAGFAAFFTAFRALAALDGFRTLMDLGRAWRG